jgi:hypothetical protein
MHNNQAAGYITADNGIRKRRATNGVHMRKADKPLLRPLAREEKRSWSNPNHNNAGAGFHVDNPYVRAVLLPRHVRAIVVEQKLLAWAVVAQTSSAARASHLAVIGLIGEDHRCRLRFVA